MPCFCICIDKPESDELRKQHLAAHFRHIEEILDQVAIAGPLRKSADQPMTGSVFIYHTDSPDEALALTQSDPYYQAGIWDQISCEHFVPAAGTWINGTIW